ncbi:MAG: T9SS type A sorting domain-containing protein [Bacteroidales bacterium]|nr:T9SS type A sorting domain-containing protein [Bacteroidales bacterium]
MNKILTIILIFIAFLANAKTKIGENIDVTHYEIHINEIDFTNHTLQAQTIVTLTTLSATNAIELELKTLTVSAVTSTDATISNFSQTGDVLTINLASSLAANATASFTITYGGNTFNESWGGIMWTNGYVCNMGVGFESIPHNLGKCWFPCVDNFTDKATYDVYVTVPNDLTAVCGGNLEGTTDNGDGTKTVHYNVPQEIATYHISFVAGDYVEWTDTYNGMERDIPITVYVKPNQAGLVQGTFVNVKDIANFFENNFGPYPFNRIGYSITSVGCMEHIDNIGITSGVLTGNTSQEEYVAHEMSHMWFGNKVTCATAEQMWLNEGFAQFCGVFYRSGIYGESDFQQAMSTKINSITKWCKNESNWIPLNNVPQTMTYDNNAVYNRGAVVVNTMMNYIGRETFLEGIRSYLNTYNYSAATSEQLRDALTNATGIDMNGFFDTYVFTAGLPHYGVDLINVTPNGNQYDATVRMTYQHVGPEHVGQNNRVEVTFIDNGGQMQTTLVNWDGSEANQNVTLDINPIAAFADYYNHFLDAKIDKNLTTTTTANLGVEQQLTITVSSVTDSVMLRGEEHFVAPDNNPNIPGLTLSTRHYWNVLRLDFGEANVSGKFTFSNNANMDGDIIQTENDSAVLLYRANINDTWHTIPYTQQGNWKLGIFTVNDVPTGQYTIGAIDKTQLGMGENILDTKKMILTPNPTNNFVKISTKTENSEILIINNLGQTINSFPICGNDATISVENFPAGIYYVNLLDEKKNIISTEKLVKK